MKIQTIPQRFKEIVEKFGSRNSLGSKIDGSYKFITYQQLSERVNNVAAALTELGVKPQDKVALMAENCPEWTMADLGIISVGALNVPVYPTLTHEQLEYILNNCGAKGLIVSNNIHYQKVVKIFDNVPSLEFVVHIQDVKKAEKMVKTLSFEELLALGSENYSKHEKEIEARIEASKLDDLCSIIYTSGTTGPPKGVMLTHNNFMSNAYQASRIIGANETDIELSFLPLSHSLERCVYYSVILMCGASIAYAENFDTIGQNLQEVHPTILASVPRVYEKIYTKVMDGVHSSPPVRQKIFNWAIKVGKEGLNKKKHGQDYGFLLEMEHKLASKLVYSKIQEKTGGNMRTLISGGAPLMKEIAEFFTYVGLPILEGYGLTETSPVISLNRPNNFKFGTVGQPIPDVEVKIAEDGEILARGPNIMKGYYNNPEATAETIDKDGWFHTGDIGELDSENFLRITDRKKELIVMSNGKNVAPQPIENLLKTSRYVEQIAVIGDNRKFMSALIVPNFDSLKEKAKQIGVNSTEPSELCNNDKILAFMKEELELISKDKLAKYEKIKKFVLLPAEFALEKNEITPTLKLKRKVINEHFKTEIESMYETTELSTAKK